MSNAQDMSPDFVLMRLVSAAEYDHLEDENVLSSGGVISGFGKPALRHHHHHHHHHHHQHHHHNGHNLGGSGFRFDEGNSVTSGPDAPAHMQDSVTENGAAATMITTTTSHTPSPDFPGSRAQLMVFQNLLRAGDRVLECGLEKPDKQEVGLQLVDSSNYDSDPHLGRSVQMLQWNPVLRLSKVAVDLPENREGLCQRHRLISDTVEWPTRVEKSFGFGTTDPHKPLTAGAPVKADDPVLSLARRLGEMGQGSDVLHKDGDSPLCSCQSILGSAGSAHPGDDPSETSDALLVLEGLGTDEVAGLERGDAIQGESAGQAFGQKSDSMTPCRELTAGASLPSAFSSSSLSGLMHQVHRLAGEACCETRPNHNGMDTRSPGDTLIRPAPVLSTQGAAVTAAPVSAPLSRPPTPKHIGSPLALSACGSREVERGSRAKSRKGSLKVCLSKLFRTKSTSSGNVPHTADKRPSLASSTSSGGSLVDVWASSGPEPDMSSRPQQARPRSSYSSVPFTGETVSLVDVDISRRGANSLHPPTPPPPPRRSLSLLDDFGGPQTGQLLASMQSLPIRPSAASHAVIQHSLSLNDTFLPGIPRPLPLEPDSQSAERVDQRPLLCPLSRPDASSFATSLRELERCGWYWGPMNWEDAEMKLKGKPDGSFLVRDSSDPRYILSLSFRSQGVTHHTRMEHYRGTFSLWCHPKFEDRCHSVVEFIERAIMHSKNGRFLYFLRSRVPGLPPTPVQLLYPVSRFSSVKSLQHLCRFCIRQLVRIDHIQELPLPTPLIVYLRKFYFYDPEEEKYLSLKESGQDTGATQQAESQT